MKIKIRAATTTAYVYGNDVALDKPNGHNNEKENGLKHGYNDNGKRLTFGHILE